MNKKVLHVTLSSLMCFAVHADITERSAATFAPTTPAAQTKPEPTPNTTSNLTSTMPSLPVINCEYAIPATTTAIDQTILSTWVESAAMQAFDFNPEFMSIQLRRLKSCFTDQGWQGYYEALVKSGNLEAIKSNALTVSSKIEGEVKIISVSDNQWKASLAMKVVYQNDKENFKQDLSVDLLIGRQVSGNLGIMQVIASQRDTAPATIQTH